MSMKFTVNVSGDFTAEVEADDLISRYDVDSDMLNLSGDVSLDDVNVSGEVRIEGHLSIEGVEVSASDLADFDADAAIEEYKSYGSSIEVSGAEFEVTESPTGFEEVEFAIGRDEAIAAYAALDNAGFEVS